jgi:hypothetical protein
MAREIHLSGGEVTILKALGLNDPAIHGRQLLDRVGEMEPGEVIDDLKGLMMLGYVVSDTTKLRTAEEIEDATFHVNANYARDLRDVLDPHRRESERRHRRRRRG